MQLPNKHLEALEEYSELLRMASYHYADDSCKEWDQAMRQEDAAWELRRQALSNCEPALRDALEQAFEKALRENHIGFVQGVFL